MRWSWSCVLAVLAACFSPRPPAGAICPPGGDCPDGQRCVGNVCVADTDPDASIDPGDAITDGSTDTPVAATWTLVQTDDSGSLNGGVSRTLTVVPTGAGNTIIVAVESDEDPITSVTDNANNTYLAIPNSRAVNLSQGFGIELWIASDAAAGATSITATTGNASELYAVVMWEVAGLATTNVIDAVATLDNQPTSGSPVGAEITTTQGGDFVISIAIVGNSVNMLLGAGFTNDHFTLGNGWAHLTSNTAPAGKYTAQWNQNLAAPYCASSVAFRRAN